MSDTPSVCPCDNPPSSLPEIPAGLPSIPRQTETFHQVAVRLDGGAEVPSALPSQTQTFPDVRRTLLAAVPQKPALQSWRARGERDFGLMWLEMWAYVADVLGFYDERISNESYIRTAVLRPSLRRLVDMLGYVPAPGTAGSATVAALAEGRTGVTVPEATKLRSSSVDGGPPQVFETGANTDIHPLSNSWEIGPVPVSIAPSESTQDLIFETANFGLGKDSVVLFTHPSIDPQASKVVDIKPFQGKDKRTYLRVTIDSAVTFAGVDLSQVKVQSPRVTASITTSQPPLNDPSDPSSGRPPIIENPGDGTTSIYFNSIYPQLHQGDPIIAVATSGARQPSRVVSVAERTVVPSNSITIQGSQTLSPVTRAILQPQLTEGAGGFDFGSPFQITFLFDFVDGGRLTLVAETEPPISAFTDTGVRITGIVETPPAATDVGGGVRVLQQAFLLRDADNQGLFSHGKIVFNGDGTADFFLAPQFDDPPLPDTLKTPVTVFGNLLDASRGESVIGEILGSGDARTPRQKFKLKKKPLTYIFDPSTPTAARSTLEISVDQILWKEVTSFFGTGPQDQVYIVRVDDQQNTFVTFGDGVRGARLPSGVDNVVANYRFGSGLAAPGPNGIRQIVKAVKGLRRIESPIAARAGKDPDPPETLRTLAPQSALLADHPVSAADFEVLANLVPGVIKAVAEFLFIDTTQGAGIVVTYIGAADQGDVVSALQTNAEPGLPIVAQRANAFPSSITIDVEVDRRFDREAVAAEVRKKLVDPDTGVLANKNAPIGRPLYRSTIFDIVHSVPGVVGIISAYGEIFDIPFDFQIAGVFTICAGSGDFIDFGQDGAGVTVNGVRTSKPVPGEGGAE